MSNTISIYHLHINIKIKMCTIWEAHGPKFQFYLLLTHWEQTHILSDCVNFRLCCSLPALSLFWNDKGKATKTKSSMTGLPDLLCNCERWEWKEEGLAKKNQCSCSKPILKPPGNLCNENIIFKYTFNNLKCQGLRR